MGGKDSPQLQCSGALQTSWDIQSKLIQKSSPPITYVPKSTSSINLDMKVNRAPLHAQRRSLRRVAPEWSRSPVSTLERQHGRKDSKSSLDQSPRTDDGSASPIRQYMECIEPRTLSCAIVGDSGVGKTSLLLGYTTGKISETHEPTIYDKFSSKFSDFSSIFSIYCRLQEKLC